MKKIILLLSLVFAISSCSLNDDKGEEFHYELLPIENVEIPSEFILGETYTIVVRYYRPTTCYAFNGFYYEKDLNVRTVAVQNVVFDSNTNCEDIDPIEANLVEASFDFYVTSNGSYIFKFWQGVDDNGEDVFYEVEVPVI